ncbi:MAG: S8 family serine peptidase [Armatimonadetes bacterium]|jgi:subtilisin family serine protease|nr:S8 family serine peptidase [Armatimonadota bacterium]
MKIYAVRLMGIMLIAACLLSAVLLSACLADEYVPPRYVQNEFIIRAVEGSSLNSVSGVVNQLGGVIVKVLPLKDTYLVRMGVTTGASTGGALRNTRVASSPWVVKSFAPNFIYTKDALPNDPYWANNKLWGLRTINMPRAWDANKGSSSVTVAVIDSGVANHPDLAGRVLNNGYDFVDNDSDPSNDLDGHGTHVAGTIAAQGDNHIGVVGVCWDGVQIMPIRFLDNTGNGTTANALLSLSHAMSYGADVVNMSWGADYGAHDTELQAQIEALDAAGLILCASAGNNGLTANPGVGEPASYPECIAVAASGPNDGISSYSSYGPGFEVDITAPGGDIRLSGSDAGIYSTVVSWVEDEPVFDYDAYEGTSMACPHVSGAAALLLSSGVPAGDVRSRLEETARQVSGMDRRRFGNGILDVAGAIANGTIFINKPTKGSTVNSAPDVRLNIRGVQVDSVRVYVDYVDTNRDGLPDNLALETPVIAGVTLSKYLNASSTAIAFNWAEVSQHPLSTGIHWIYVSARTSVGDELVYDWGAFEVASRVIPAGQHLCAFPYNFAVTHPDGTIKINTLPSDLLLDAATGAEVDFRYQSVNRARLHRWSTPDNDYFSYITGLVDPDSNEPKLNDQCWVYPFGTFDGNTVPTAGGFLSNDSFRHLNFPAGSGFWLTLQRDVYINSTYSEVSAPQGFSINLFKGWNLIGNPYTVSVPLSAIRLNYRGAIRTLDEDQLSSNRWVDAIFFGYDGSGYKIVPADRRLLDPYKGYWLRALVGGTSPNDKLTMSVH